MASTVGRPSLLDVSVCLNRHVLTVRAVRTMAARAVMRTRINVWSAGIRIDVAQNQKYLDQHIKTIRQDGGSTDATSK
ncbi:hypothetical protein CHS0354_021396 [Potamilus streckersoni]|uniref:Uncharacterized protein n=1 Tax=Potamilus streckersoni TaxID=2493646 RepID=A0AAE0S231_9BIVA|nr:hypothetical protein CHS0354_021396 [Potamilus streckersoni]